MPIWIVGKASGITVGVAAESNTQPVLDLYSKLFVVVLNITNPDAGETIAFRWVVVMRGGKNPFVVDVTSNCADGFILAVDTPMPTWALLFVEINNAIIKAVKRKVFFMFKFFYFFLFKNKRM